MASDSERLIFHAPVGEIHTDYRAQPTNRRPESAVMRSTLAASTRATAELRDVSHSVPMLRRITEGGFVDLVNR